MKFPRTFSITHLLDLDYLGPISQLFNDNSSINPTVGFQNATTTHTNVGKTEPGEMAFDYSASADFQYVNHNHNNNNFFNQPVFVNPAFDWNGLGRWRTKYKKQHHERKKHDTKLLGRRKRENLWILFVKGFRFDVFTRRIQESDSFQYRFNVQRFCVISWLIYTFFNFSSISFFLWKNFNGSRFRPICLRKPSAFDKVLLIQNDKSATARDR